MKMGGIFILMSQSPQTGQFNSYNQAGNEILKKQKEKSQSPQTGQFNSYPNYYGWKKSPALIVSIPSNGSIQFLQRLSGKCIPGKLGLNPLKRVNSILTICQILKLKWKQNVSIPSNGSIQFLHSLRGIIDLVNLQVSQSPQTGQFNSYSNSSLINSLKAILSLNPLKRVNSILTLLHCIRY